MDAAAEFKRDVDEERAREGALRQQHVAGAGVDPRLRDSVLRPVPFDLVHALCPLGDEHLVYATDGCNLHDFKPGDQVTVDGPGAVRTRMHPVVRSMDLTGACLAGGCITSLLTAGTATQFSDYDVFVIARAREEWVAQLVRIVNHVIWHYPDRESWALSCSECGVTITCHRTRDQPALVLQVVGRLYDDVSHVLTGFDLDACTLAYMHGEGGAEPRVVGLQRGIRALRHRVNVVDEDHQSTTYESRLHKYAVRKGFDVLLLHTRPHVTFSALIAHARSGRRSGLLELQRLRLHEHQGAAASTGGEYAGALHVCLDKVEEDPQYDVDVWLKFHHSLRAKAKKVTYPLRLCSHWDVKEGAEGGLWPLLDALTHLQALALMLPAQLPSTGGVNRTYDKVREKMLHPHGAPPAVPAASPLVVKRGDCSSFRPTAGDWYAGADMSPVKPEAPVECSICHNDINADSTQNACCRNRFHSRCLGRWLKQCGENQQQPHCPMCRCTLTRHHQ